MEERIVALINQKRYFVVLEKLKANTKFVPKNQETILRFLRESELGKTTLKGQKKKIGCSRLLRCIVTLRLMDNVWFRKPFEDITEEEMDTFILGLDRDAILKKNGEPYTSESKTSIKKFIRKFYKWLLGDNETYPKMVRCIDTSYKIPEIKPLTKEETDLLIENSPKMLHKFIIAFLFDSGARIEEFLNMKISDLSKDNGTYKARITISKTKPRTINLPLYSSIIENYLALHPSKDDTSSYLCSLNYNSVRKMLFRVGHKTLGKRVYPHLFRHSSATFYANRMKSYQICHRYGWSLSSNMPSRYIDFNGLTDQEAIKGIKEEINLEATKENQQLKQELSLIMSNLKDLQEREQQRAELEQKRQIEQQLHSDLFAKSVTFDNKEGINDIREIMFQILKSDKGLIEKLKSLK